MNEEEFKERVRRLQDIGKALEKLPPEVRSDAFALLKEYASSQATAASSVKKDQSGQKKKRVSADESEEAFFGRFDHDKPSDNARLIAANFYRQYGSDPFSIDEVRTDADDVGLTIPSRVDMTFLQAKDNGKKLFTRAGKGMFKPTVHGEAYLKSTYSIRKGTQKRPKAAE